VAALLGRPIEFSDLEHGRKYDDRGSDKEHEIGKSERPEKGCLGFRLGKQQKGNPHFNGKATRKLCVEKAKPSLNRLQAMHSKR
jgi:hypothetical protein